MKVRMLVDVELDDSFPFRTPEERACTEQLLKEGELVLHSGLLGCELGVVSFVMFIDVQTDEGRTWVRLKPGVEWGTACPSLRHNGQVHGGTVNDIDFKTRVAGGSRATPCYPSIGTRVEIRDGVEMTVFCDGQDREVHEALRRITPEWVESGESCHQTVIDLADACRELLVRLAACRTRLNREHRKASHGCTDAICKECDG